MIFSAVFYNIVLLHTEQLCNSFFLELCTNNTKSAYGACRACSYIGHTGNIVIVYPCAVSTLYDALCTQNIAVLLLILKCLQRCTYLIGCELLCSFSAPAGEYFICMVVVMIVVVAAAGAVLVMFVVMMLVLIVIVVMMLMLVVIVVVMLMVMVVIMAAAGAVLAVFVMVVLMLIFVMVMVVMMMLMLIFVVVMVMMMLMLLFKQSLQLVIKSILLCHGISELLACQLVPLGSNYGSLVVQGAEPCYHIVQSFLRNTCGMAEDKAACIGYLVVEELTEILLIHLALSSINNSCETVQYNIVCVDILHCLDNIAELAHARWLYEYTVGLVGIKHLDKCLAEIAHQ